MATVYDKDTLAGPIPAVRMASSTNAGIGAWLILAPFILGYATIDAALWNDVVCGAWLVVAGLTRAGGTRKNEWLSWTNLGFGVWLILAPFILNYEGEAAEAVLEGEAGVGADPIAGAVGVANVTGAYWNDVVVGILVAVLAAYAAMKTRQAKHDAATRVTTT
jgi:hypothetical protein